MMELLYNLGINLYSLALRIAAPFNIKAAQLHKGRGETWEKLKAFTSDAGVAWVHCASLGEFEQGRPLIEAIRKEKPELKIVLTFFSPSGFEVRKNYNMADVVVYLPADTSANAKRFLKTVKPTMAIFIKYEFWFNYLTALKNAKIPVYSVSSIFRDNQIFFKWYGGWFRNMLKAVTMFYVQDKKSGTLLETIGIENFVVAGDTRFDRVASIADSAADVPVAREFAAQGKVIVAGSSWPADEVILADYINNSPNEVKLIIAPHEVHESHITQLIQRFKVPVMRYSDAKNNQNVDCRVLIIDTIGLLSAIYRYGSIAYIGGGFGKGIHNTLEAATYGMPVIFGPNHKRFKEAIDLIEVGGGFSISSLDDFSTIMNTLWNANTIEALEKSGLASKNYVQSMCGATPMVITDLLFIKKTIS
jgi:3-deoxy-D-manno-octulosonic-acid transferase